jgi:hypothetical protein
MSDALWPGAQLLLFPSGTAALGNALRLAFAAMGASSPRTVLLPAYGCPNLAAAALWAGAVPEYYDISRETLGPAPGVLERLRAANNTAMVHVDAFGAPTVGIEAAGLEDRLVHDLAQSFAPYQPNWRPNLPLSVLSYGRAKPVSLTFGGALLIERPSEALSREIASVSATWDMPGWKWGLRTALYSLSLHPMVFGALARIPALGIGQTSFSPLTEARRLPQRWAGVMAAAVGEVRGSFDVFVRQTAAMLKLALDSGARVPASALQALGRLPLWRIPVLCPTPDDATALAKEGLHLGVSRLYARALPQIMEVAPPDVAARWPNAAWIAERLVTLPAHGRLSKACEDELRHLLTTRLRLR